jgi:phage shock protein PspC (stress-responsive transcriptional regulator)
MAFVLLALAGGLWIVLYLLLWMLTPRASSGAPAPD